MPAKMSYDADMTAFFTRMRSVNFKYRACGIGVIDDKGTKPKGVMCTEMNYVEPARCAETFDPTRTYTIPTGTVCLQWPDRTNNACVGDFGGNKFFYKTKILVFMCLLFLPLGPVYAYKLDAKGNVVDQEVFCTMIGSPNLRSGSPCLDAHITVCTFLPGPIGMGNMNPTNWAANIINPPPPPPPPTIADEVENKQ